MANGSSHGVPPIPPHQYAFDPGALAVVRQSAAWLARNQDEFVSQLHRDVTGLIPQSAVPPGFNMWAFCGRMVQTLLRVALTDQPLNVVSDMLRQVGAQNWYEGFPDAQYPSVAHALIQTVHYLTENSWSTSTGSAWITFFMWVRPHLLDGAEQAAARTASARDAAAQQAAAERAAAEREAARVKALSRDPRGGHSHVVSDVNIERVASLLDDDEEEQDVGLGQLMVNMTRNPRRDPRRHHGQ